MGDESDVVKFDAVYCYDDIETKANVMNSRCLFQVDYYDEPEHLVTVQERTVNAHEEELYFSCDTSNTSYNLHIFWYVLILQHLQYFLQPPHFLVCTFLVTLPILLTTSTFSGMYFSCDTSNTSYNLHIFLYVLFL